MTRRKSSKDNMDPQAYSERRRQRKASGGRRKKRLGQSQMTHASSGRANKKRREGERKMDVERESL